jgi:hypothetical protein
LQRASSLQHQVDGGPGSCPAASEMGCLRLWRGDHQAA